MLLHLLFAVLLVEGYAGEAEKHRVIVVGAGVAGFTAASTLLQHNVSDLLVLEAADRIGGRINTVQFGGVTIERGAEFVHGEKGNAVYEMVSSYNLLTSYEPLVTPDKFMFVNTSEHIFDGPYIKGLLDKAYAITSEEEIKNATGSLADYFYSRFNATLAADNASPELLEALLHLTPQLEGVMNAADLKDIGRSCSYDYVDAEGDQILKWKSGGYKTIFDFLSKKIPNPEEELPVVNKTLLGKQVTTIERREGDVAVKCADGSSYLADHVIVTLSLAVLKKHAADMFHPALPTDKTAAIETLGMGCVAKIFLLFPTRWWPSDKTVIVPLFSRQELLDFQKNSQHGSWTSYTLGFHPVMNHERMMCVWFSGSSCVTMESLTDEQVEDGLMELLDKTLGSKFNISRPEALLRSDWASYPYTLGAYSYRSVASDQQNLTNSHLASPVMEGDKPVILFAGEATHSHQWSSVHGALATGRREAHNLIKYLEEHDGLPPAVV